MSEELMAWFHCGHCAALFRSEAGESDDRRCTACGKDPSLGLEVEVPAGTPVNTAKDPMLRVKRAEVEAPKFFKREVRRHKGRYFAVKLVLVWAVLMGVLALCGHYFWKDEGRAAAVSGVAEKGTFGDPDAMLVQKEYSKCAAAMGGFINAGTPEEKNQFVRKPVETAGKMARYYQSNPLHHIDPSTMRGAASGVIRLRDGSRLIETRWTVGDGRSIEAVFFNEKGEWRLDWEDYVRYSDEPWALFLSGEGPAEGEFRMFARERSPGERSALGNIRIFLHAPVFGHPDQAGEASPEFVLEQLSSDGRRLMEAFKKQASGGRIFGSTIENRDPENMIRVRVKVRRTDGAAGREFKITAVEACHWLSIDDPGTDE